jgi:fluoroacetyl-CoA thioesterase
MRSQAFAAEAVALPNTGAACTAAMRKDPEVMRGCCQANTLTPSPAKGNSMKSSLQSGVAGTATYTVTAEMSPPHLPTKVLSTPSMVQLIEATCLQTAQLHLDEGETTVGTHVCVSHAASAAAGEDVVVTCELTEIDRRRLEFTIRVTSGDKVLSEGTHQRFVVKTASFG